MDKREFEAEVRCGGRQLAVSAIDVAISHFIEHRSGRLDKEAVRECIQLAGLIEQCLANIPQASTATEVVAFPPPPAAYIHSQLLASKISPRVKELRHHFFGCAEPPFRVWDDAARWLTQSSEKEVFERACQELAEDTGFPEGEIERYILLSDAAPYLSNIEVKLSTSAYRTQAVIQINAMFSDDQARTAVREVRKALGVSRLKGVTSSDQCLLELVRQVGDSPPKGMKGHKAYWERIRLMWNADTRFKPYPDGRALKIKYKRLLVKLDKLGDAR